MARSRSSGGRSSGGFSRPRPASKPSKPAPPARSPTPPPARKPEPATVPAPMQSGSSTGGLGSAIADGMAFGGGSAIGHRVADAVLGPRVVRHETVAASAPGSSGNSDGGSQVACAEPYKAFQDCLETNASDVSRCQFYMDMIMRCRKA